MKSLLYGELTNADIEQAIAEGYMAIVPMGCTEQHGPHLPVDSDTFLVSAPLHRALQLTIRIHTVAEHYRHDLVRLHALNRRALQIVVALSLNFVNAPPRIRLGEGRVFDRRRAARVDR